MKYKTIVEMNGDKANVEVLIYKNNRVRDDEVLLSEKRELLLGDVDTDMTNEEYANDYAENILLVDIVRNIKSLKIDSNEYILDVKVNDKYGILKKYPKKVQERLLTEEAFAERFHIVEEVV